jgi:voltage-gated potassium channel
MTPNLVRVRGPTSDRLENLRLRGAVLVIVVTATTLAVVAAIVERLIDPAFDDMGDALWWSVSTVSTVGYGDIVPESTPGRIAASVLMLTGLALIPTLTSVVVAILVAQRSRRERQAGAEQFERVVELLRSVDDRLDRLERGGSGRS